MKPPATRDAAAGKPSLLIVDDDPLIADSLAFALGRDFAVTPCLSRADCVDLLRNTGMQPRLALVDLGLPPTPHRPDQGFALIAEILAHSPQTRILVLSGQNAEANARHARALGAMEFVAKPCEPARLREILLRLLMLAESAEALPPADDHALIGNSLPMLKLREQIRLYAESPFPVLIEGESGSGKDVVASQYLHRRTSRADKPFLALNCAAMSPSLVEPTLFGHVKGAFTGASGSKSGYFEDAGEGTLFLDEIGELPLELQPKLLRVLENGEFQRVGDTQPRFSKARVIAATNRDLRREVREGRFRADLYHRLSVFTISVPPLRDMGTDKLLLLDHFRDAVARRTGMPAFALDADARRLWEGYGFPGNVRELRNIVIRLSAKFPAQHVPAAALADEFDSEESAEDTAARSVPTSMDDAVAVAERHLQRREAFSLNEMLDLWEHAYIEAALKLAHGNVSHAARLLGINRTTLYNRMEAMQRARSGKP